MDQALRNALWNWTLWALDTTWTRTRSSSAYWNRLARQCLWDEFFHTPVDEIPHHDYEIPKRVKAWFMKAEWYDVYNFVEYVLPRVNETRDYGDAQKDVEASLNRVLERELAGYRAVKGQLVPITSTIEIDEIVKAGTSKTGFELVAQHINTALALLGKKPDPDYRNSVKESISAVETAAKLLSGEKSGGIDTSLAILDRQFRLHPAFKTALSKLYAYTSDKDGIRHSMLEAATIAEPEARFMLIACSAFANWLIAAASAKQE